MQSGADEVPPADSNGNRKILETIFRRYHDELHKFVLRKLGSSEDVDEIVQDVFLRLIRHGKLDEVRNPRAFIFHIAKNLLKDRAGSQYIRFLNKHVSTSEIELVSPLPSPEEILRSKEAGVKITQILESVDPETRSAFILRRFRGLSYRKIASEMGISQRRAKYHLHCMMIQFRKAFEDRRIK